MQRKILKAKPLLTQAAYGSESKSFPNSWSVWFWKQKLSSLMKRKVPKAKAFRDDGAQKLHQQKQRYNFYSRPYTLSSVEEHRPWRIKLPEIWQSRDQYRHLTHEQCIMSRPSSRRMMVTGSVWRQWDDRRFTGLYDTAFKDRGLQLPFFSLWTGLDWRCVE